MVLNIVPDHICRYLVANGASKISIFPQFSSPQLFLDRRVLFEYDAGTDSLEHHYHFRDTISGWKRQKDMDVILRDLKGVYCKVVMYGNLLKDFFCSCSDVLSQDPLSVFRCLHQMIFRFIDRIACSLQYHAGSIAQLSLPSAGELFIPVYKTGYSSSGSS